MPFGDGDGYYEDAENQLNQYQSINNNLTRGEQLASITNIEIVYNNNEKYPEHLKMNIEFTDKGKILYDFYLVDGSGKFLRDLTTSQAEDYVEANHNYPPTLDFRKKKKGKRK